jgi:hypothetical protein
MYLLFLGGLIIKLARWQISGLKKTFLGNNLELGLIYEIAAV